MRKLILLVLAMPLLAQDSLSLREAVQLALRENKAIAATNAGIERFQCPGLTRPGPGRLPKLNYSESFARSDNPGLCFQLVADAAPVRR